MRAGPKRATPARSGLPWSRRGIFPRGPDQQAPTEASTVTKEAATVHAGIKLTADQIAALAPGDAVIIESGAETGRPRHTSGTVVRITGSQVVVSVSSARGVSYIQCYSRRDAYRVGRGSSAALVTVENPAADPANIDQHREQRRIDALWRAWSRNRGDAEALRALHAALGERLGVG